MLEVKNLVSQAFNSHCLASSAHMEVVLCMNSCFNWCFFAGAGVLLLSRRSSFLYILIVDLFCFTF